MRGMTPHERRHSAWWLSALLAAAVSLACGGPPPTRVAPEEPPSVTAGHAVVASPPPGVSAEQLGLPFDAQFRPLPGAEARSLFLGASGPRKRSDNRVEHQYLVVETEELLAANAKGWGLTPSDLTSERRYASYRALKITETEGLDDPGTLRNVPDDAVYFLARIYYGHSYEALFSGDAHTFHAGIRAELAGLQGPLVDFATRHGLTMKATGRGLRPSTPKAAFARTPEQIDASFTDSGPSVPVLVEFRQIRTRTGLSGVIAWPEPVYVELRLVHLAIEQEGTSRGARWRTSLTCQTNDGPLPVPDPLVWTGDAVTGGSYVIDKAWVFQLFPGDRFDCGIGGIAGTRPLPVAWMGQPIQVDSVMSVADAMRSPDPSMAYAVHFTASAVPAPKEEPDKKAGH